MPPRAHIESGLRLATERFAIELSQPTGRAPDWSDFQWTMARAAAVMHGVTPLLASLTGWEPDQWLQFAGQQRYQTTLRQQRLAEVLALIDRGARTAALPIIALKGSTLHALGLYRAGERPMADIDLLVAPHESTRIGALLESLGFGEVGETWKHRIFERRTPPGEQPLEPPPFGEHAGATVKIELHRHIAERLPVIQTDITEYIWPREAQPGVNPYPSVVALMLHLLLHAAGNMASLGLRLIHLHDLALLAARFSRIEWDALLQIRISGQPPWWALPPLELVARYYPDRVPSTVIAALRPLCPRTLRERACRQTISDVSFCMLGLRAFPALPWAAAPFGKLDYIRSCVRPDQDIRAARAIVDREPYAADYSWRRQRSQARQILHWLLARPLRAAPMYMVRVAIADQAARAERRPPRADVPSDPVRMP